VANLDLQALEPLLRAALAEDIGPGDLTSELLVPEDAIGVARIRAKQAGVIAGMPIAREVLRIATGGGLEVRAEKLDGDTVRANTLVFEASGPARGLLAGERTALNFLNHLCGIATLTAQFVAAVAGTPARILDTRKTTPGLRALEKHAVVAGGGENHRYALYDRILVKENHLAFGGDLATVQGHDAIVEVESLDEFDRAVAAGAAVVMLDDFTPEQVEQAAARRGNRPTPELEVSGGMNLETVRRYAEAGADRISVGALTHSAPALDLSMRITPAL
jgi:nicotinate-nucleotide pyrophosphorylase (carboxylating)